jgi:hypothetical protein
MHYAFLSLSRGLLPFPFPLHARSRSLGISIHRRSSLGRQSIDFIQHLSTASGVNRCNTALLPS